MLRPQSGQRRGVGRLLSYFVDDGFGHDGVDKERLLTGNELGNP
jgi:hypothetical protein